MHEEWGGAPLEHMGCWSGGLLLAVHEGAPQECDMQAVRPAGRISQPRNQTAC